MIAKKFGIFDHIEDIPGTSTSRLFQDRLTLIKMADDAGFAGYHLAEHHDSDLCMAPSQELFIAAASQVTQQIRLGPMVKRFFDFPTMPMSTKPLQERIPFWYPGSPLTAGRHGMSLMWPGRISEAAYEQYLQAWHDHKDDGIRFDGPDSEPRVGYSMLLAIADTEAEARDVARRGMEGLVRRTHNAHRFDHLKLSEQDCYDAQGPLRAIHANMEPTIQIGSGTPPQIIERVGALLDDGMVDYICFMFPTGDMTFEESRRTLELLITDVIPHLEPSSAGAREETRR